MILNIGHLCDIIAYIDSSNATYCLNQDLEMPKCDG